MASKILLIVEGEKKDVSLVEKLFAVYIPKMNKEIVPYRTNIYELYSHLSANYGNDLENADLMKKRKRYLIEVVILILF